MGLGVKMLRVDARRVSARVVYDVPSRYIPERRVVCDAMRPSTLPPKEEGAISIFIKRREPNPAPSLGFFYLGIESGKLRVREIFKHVAPPVSQFRS